MLPLFLLQLQAFANSLKLPPQNPKTFLYFLEEKLFLGVVIEDLKAINIFIKGKRNASEKIMSGTQSSFTASLELCDARFLIYII